MSSGKSGEREGAGSPQEWVFLDTSIFLATLKHEKLRERVRETLNEFRWRSTASHAKLEYGNNVLSVASYYYRKLQDLKDLPALFYHIDHRLLPQLRSRTEITYSDFPFSGRYRRVWTHIPC